MSSDYVVPEPRIDLPRLAKEQYRALNALDAGIELDPVLRELIKIRASQINGCAFCLDLHLREAREAGETSQRLDTIAGWHDSPFFTARERAALALTESITRLSDGRVPDSVYAEAAGQFDEQEVGQLIFAITTINAWNRLSVTSGRLPRPR